MISLNWSSLLFASTLVVIVPFTTPLGASVDQKTDLESFVSTTLQSSTVFGKVVIHGEGRTDGHVFAVQGDPPSIVLVAGKLACGFQLEDSETEAKIECLDGDVFNGKIVDTAETTRFTGKFINRGKAKIIIYNMGLASFREGVSRLDSIDSAFVMSLAKNIKEVSKEVVEVVEQTAVSQMGSPKNLDTMSVRKLIEDSKQTCLELGFAVESNDLARCTLKLLEKNL